MSQTFCLSINDKPIALPYQAILTNATLDNPNDGDRPVAEVNRNPDDPTILGLRNLSPQEWYITFADGDSKQIAPGRSVKLEANMVINFGDFAGTIRTLPREKRDPSPSPKPRPSPPKPAPKKLPKPAKLPPPRPPATSPPESPFPWGALAGITGIVILGYAGYRASQPTAAPPPTPTVVEEKIDYCAEVERKKRNYQGKINWAAVDKAFWQQTNYPYGQPLDSSYPNYQYYRQKWCEIANRFLS
jgi:hypothetical protein